MRRLIHEASNHKIVLLTTISTKQNLEQYLELSIKKADDAFECVVRIEGGVGSSINRQPNPGITDIMLQKEHIRPSKS